MAENRTKIIQTRLGDREISEDGIIHFPRGLIGFETLRDFVLIQISDNSPFLLLQNLEESALGLLVADPYSFLAEYEVKLAAAEKSLLQVKQEKDLAILVTASIPKENPQDTTLNLTGPIVMNTQCRLGLQVSQTNSAFPSRFHIMQKD